MELQQLRYFRKVTEREHQSSPASGLLEFITQRAWRPSIE
jgi:hypothetical protein